MFSTYKQVVLQTYLRKKAAGSLSFRLLEPTPAGIKEELTQYLNERFDPKKDEQTLELFFGHHESAAAYAKVVRRVEIDKFRPVIKFLKGLTDNPDDKQVHLAALLIDFRERPYEFGKEYSLEEENDPIAENEENIESKDGDPEVEETDGKNPVKEPEEMGENEDIKVRRPFFLKTINKKKSVFTLLLVLLFGSLGFVVSHLTDDKITGKQCMYWKGDHYEAIECDIKLAADIDKIALDTFLLKNFKKITRVDTITERSIGKIWYLKHQKSFDFFTAKGVHPIHKRKLSRLSKIIYDNEIKPLKTAE
ncbi:hypothetical protein [Pedobacter montanisoli]|uniref:Uncharacterized protein n=1 Tax=Pedobacter montanisoli TaxID=2923277 RepID=A0ABS9ZUE7_9SPHI|nr:hypothetical protein [Pedobacter montanisoli]MCJ0742226.1 hypothetical protein [Pedobacter montanisoli]